MKNVGLLAFHLIKDARQKTLSHLHAVYGHKKPRSEIEEMARSVFINLGRNAVDAIRLSMLKAANLDSIILQISGLDHLNQTIQKGYGVILISAHLGCWELIGAYLASQGYSVAVLAKKLYDARLNGLVEKIRHRAGYKSIPRNSDMRPILRWLRQGNILGILMDQDTNVRGEFVDFMGRPAYTPAGPVILARHTGAAVLPVAIHLNERNRHIIEFGEEIQLQNTGIPQEDLVKNVSRCSKAIEHFIRRNPTQWVWMHERWKTRPEKLMVN